LVLANGTPIYINLHSTYILRFYFFFFHDRHIIRSYVLFNFFLYRLNYDDLCTYGAITITIVVWYYILYYYYNILRTRWRKPTRDPFCARGRLIRNCLKRFSYPSETITANERRNKKNQQKTVRIVIYRDFLVYLCGAPE
jgi:hypothetical protein